MQRLAISGVTLSGNLGGQAMLVTTIQQVRRRAPHAELVLLSVFPKEDLLHDAPAALHVVSARPSLLVLCYLPLSLLVWPVAGTNAVRRVLRRIKYFAALMDSSMLLDHCGIAFSDGRGLALLAYNVATCVPAIVLGTPVLKLPQALGPFRERTNRIAARFVLNRCQGVFARGSLSASFLRQLQVRQFEQKPDVSFALEITRDASVLAQRYLDRGNVRAPILTVAPSRVVEKYCVKKNIDFVAILRTVVEHAVSKGYRVIVLVHSHGTEASSNDDLPVCRRLREECSEKVELIDDVSDAMVARALIGQSRLFIGSRFHAIVGALAMGVPALALGWSHKYSELLAEFRLADYALGYENLSANAVLERFSSLEAAEVEIRRTVSETARRMRNTVESMYASVLGPG